MRRILANAAFKYYQVNEGRNKRGKVPSASLVLSMTSSPEQSDHSGWQKKRKNKDSNKRFLREEQLADVAHDVDLVDTLDL
jgi:hypothetical protein